MDVQPHLLNLSAYINQNLEKDLPLSTLAKRVGLSPFHFHRKFGAYFGESLHQHIKRLRLERAAFALVHGNAPVRQIARESGYKTVSAFSHAFSGFAGESPTKYRTLASSEPSSDDDAAPAERLRPAWIGELPPREIAFVRAIGRGQHVEGPVHDAIALIVKLVGSLKSVVPAGHEDESDAPSTDGVAFEAFAVTSDVYGVLAGRDFRIDVGLDTERIPDDRSGALGRQTLPGGRYARYDIRCRPDELVDQCMRISLSELRERGETPRLAQYFVRFLAGTPSRSEPVDHAVFVPLIG